MSGDQQRARLDKARELLAIRQGLADAEQRMFDAVQARADCDISHVRIVDLLTAEEQAQLQHLHEQQEAREEQFQALMREIQNASTLKENQI